jgi:hypothetical protein
MCLCHTHGPKVVIIIIRHILRINSLSRLLLFIYLLWSAYPASHKVTHECIALVILAVARNDSNNARTDKYCAPRVKLLGSLGRAQMKNNNKQIEILAASFNLIIWPACRDKMPLMGTFTVQQWRKLLILPAFAPVLRVLNEFFALSPRCEQSLLLNSECFS